MTICRLLGMMFCAGLVAASPQTQPATSAPSKVSVQVHIRLVTPDSRDLPSLPFYLSDIAAPEKDSVVAFGLSDSHGDATLAGMVDATVKELAISFHISYEDRRFYSLEERNTFAGRIDELRKAFWLPELGESGLRALVPLKAGQVEYTVELQALPGVAISGTVMQSDGNGPFTTARVCARRASTYGGTSRNGSFVLYGAPTAEPNDIFVFFFPEVVSIVVSAEQSRGPCVLPPIKRPEWNATGELDFEVSGLPDVSQTLIHSGRGWGLTPGVFLVRDDGAVMLSWLVQGSKTSNKHPKAPAGKYYVAPGVFAARDFQLAILDAVRSGADLSASGVPTVVVKDNSEVTSMAFDAVAALKAIDRIVRNAKTNP